MSLEPNAFSLDQMLDELATDSLERALMARTFDLLGRGLPEVEPPPSLRHRVLAQSAIAGRGPMFEDSGFAFARGNDLPWIQISPGIRMKFLHGDLSQRVRTALVEMAPNLLFPSHDHDGIEDLYLISGDAWVGDIPMRAGDYCRAPDGTTHDAVRSGASGALAVVVQR
jgi:quercetin dioxygenase-like cupin family protein